MTDADFMRYAIELGRRKMQEIGAAPFAAVVVKDGRIVGEGCNTVLIDHDPTPRVSSWCHRWMYESAARFAQASAASAAATRTIPEAASSRRNCRSAATPHAKRRSRRRGGAASGYAWWGQFMMALSVVAGRRPYRTSAIKRFVAGNPGSLRQTS